MSTTAHIDTCPRGHAYDVRDGFCETCAEYEMEVREPNQQAREGCDRCYCGCKYWEGDACIDCGTTIAECMSDPEWTAENRVAA